MKKEPAGFGRKPRRASAPPSPDHAAILASGFPIRPSAGRAVPLVPPVIRKILDAGSGQAILRVSPRKQARCYEIRFAVLGAGGQRGEWQPGGLFTNPRAILIPGLTPGTLYVFQARAVGGSTGCSDWSDAVRHRSM